MFVFFLLSAFFFFFLCSLIIYKNLAISVNDKGESFGASELLMVPAVHLQWPSQTARTDKPTKWFAAQVTNCSVTVTTTTKATTLTIIRVLLNIPFTKISPHDTFTNYCPSVIYYHCHYRVFLVEVSLKEMKLFNHPDISHLLAFSLPLINGNGNNDIRKQ